MHQQHKGSLEAIDRPSGFLPIGPSRAKRCPALFRTLAQIRDHPGQDLDAGLDTVDRDR
jgi:hypothetical protein